MTTPDDLTPMEARLAAVAAAALDAMPAELVDECRTLVALDPESGGMRVHHDGDLVVLTWVGRVLARVPHSWLVGGEG